MEEVLEKLSSASVSEAGGSSGFDLLFKNRGRQGSQDERRRWILDSQKRQRNEKLDESRKILELVEELETDMDWSSRDKVRYRPRVEVPGFQRGVRSYRDMLMLSEWLVERPEDLQDCWYMTPCPKGTRVLLVAAMGRTKLFTKHGYFLLEGRSALPGGHPSGKRAPASVLDCVWHEATQTLHVLDLLAWNNQPMTDCDTEFRHYWLSSQLAECASVKVLSKRNHFIFSLLPKVPCEPTQLSDLLRRVPMFPNDTPALDGLLLYHKSAHYTGGSTPLVGWLYPYMVNEVLGTDISVHPAYSTPPSGYTTQADFILKFEEKRAKKTKPCSRTDVDTNNGTNTTPDTDADTMSTDPVPSAANTEDSMDSTPVEPRPTHTTTTKPETDNDTHIDS